MEAPIGPAVYIVCSDVTQNGKTLLARLYADFLGMRKSISPVIFDTDLSGNGIVNYFPNATRPIDLARIQDQIGLFDTILNAARGTGPDGPAEEPPDFVVDVAASELDRFFRIFHDIDFEAGAEEAGIYVQVSYIIRWTLKSLRIADAVRSKLTTTRFVAVRNMAIDATAFTPDPEDPLPVPEIDIELFLKKPSKRVARIVNDERFSFARFIIGRYSRLDGETEREIWDLLEDVYNQIV